MWTQAEISQRMRDALYLLDPEISLEPGTPERKIVDAVAQVLGEVQIDKFVQDYTFDLDTKFGQDLDDFVSIFGFARQAARRATGYVTFSRQTPAPAPVLIPAGTLVFAPATSIAPEVSFRTVSDSVIGLNQTSVQTLVEAVVAGSIGNISSGKISSIVGVAVSNVSSVSNSGPTSGGTDQESDAELKVRFRNTVFRNIAGTMDQFLAIALSADQTDHAIVIGPVSQFSEYVQIPLDGNINSSNPYAKYIYPQNYFLSSDGTDSALLYIPGTDYTWGTATTVYNTFAPIVRITNVANSIGTVQPTIASNGTGVLTGVNYQWAYTYVYSKGGESGLSTASAAYSPVNESIAISNIGLGTGVVNDLGGTPIARNIYRYQNGNWGIIGSINNVSTSTFVDNYVGIGNPPPASDLVANKILYLEHQYISENSRNYVDDIKNISILNKVDIYISGLNSEDGSDVVTGPGIGFTNDTTSKFYFANFTRFSGTAVPTFPALTSKFIQLMWTPIATIPDQLVVNGITYTKDFDYWLVKDNTNIQGSTRARDGIEVSSTMATGIDGSSFPISYTFNKLPTLTQTVIDRHKQVGQDVLVHEAQFRYFKINLVAIYKAGFAKSNVDQGIENALTAFFEQQNFGAVIQPGDILQTVYQVPGIDTVRFGTSFDDSSHYFIEEVDVNGNTINYFNPNLDLTLQDVELPLFFALGPNSDGPIQKTQNTWMT